MKTLENDLSGNTTPLHVFDADNSLRLHYQRLNRRCVVGTLVIDRVVLQANEVVKEWNEAE